MASALKLYAPLSVVSQLGVCFVPSVVVQLSWQPLLSLGCFWVAPGAYFGCLYSPWLRRVRYCSVLVEVYSFECLVVTGLEFWLEAMSDRAFGLGVL